MQMSFDMGSMIFQMMVMAIAWLTPVLLTLAVIWLVWRFVKAQESMAASIARIADDRERERKTDSEKV
jgi:uncharacterized membrane protein YqjE